MRKVLFYLFIVLSLVTLFSVLKVIIIDLKDSTEYDYGFIFGKMILLMLFVGIAVKLK